MPDRTETMIRAALRQHEPPRPSATLTEDICRLASAYEMARTRRTTLTRRVLLVGYWAAASVASGWILWSLPWPEWKPGALSTASAWLIPLGILALIAYAPALERIRAWSARLLPPEPLPNVH